MADPVRPTSKKNGDLPPTYRIDLSLPPAQRYVELAEIYREKMRSLTGLFDELVESVIPGINIIWVKRAARLLLRRLYSHEETEEIKGISRTTGIDLYLLVSLNVLLDLLMGCTSGGARCGDAPDANSKMLHFRTLDWDMNGLRQLIVQLEFVRSPHTEHILATSITYVGFVGVLTGVRKNLSVSLNFRPYHDTSRRFGNVKFYASHLLVLLGVRRSISSVLRQCLLPPSSTRWSFLTSIWRGARRPAPALSLRTITAELPRIPTTAAYIILSDGNSTTVLEKDYRSALTRTSSSFIVATNNDTEVESSEPSTATNHINTPPKPQTLQLVGLEGLVEDSIERRNCMQSFWDEKVSRANHSQASAPTEGRNPLPRTRSSSAVVSQQPAVTLTSSITISQDCIPQQGVSKTNAPQIQEVTATQNEIIEWTSSHPITNEMTHFATVMDPTEGQIVWIRRYPYPLAVAS
ncbi:hypothetical protein AJ78_08324 [Emergomyces pasteurianus Ep9510]|uniref:ceramidase n=1 Tax=Emergomyces pasteurianus Ep9510 TaxID=1447872 RepID=A0A1J9P1T9_9EURO|nr:hypothetical protein AJ78_08324 [Emergomyces pasteurianus Ep9510]